MEQFERVLCVKPEVFVYQIPARTSNRGYRAADWKLDEPAWTGRLRLLALGDKLFIKLEDKNTGELFAQGQIDGYPGLALESVLDSSRYFVFRIQDDSGRHAFVGVGFADRSDSFDLIVNIQDHFKFLKRTENDKAAEADLLKAGPKLDLGFKEGQTITINIGSKKEGAPKKRPQGSGAATPGLLPPPPGGVKLPGPPGSMQTHQTPVKPAPPTAQPSKPVPSAGGSGLNDLLNLEFASSTPSTQSSKPAGSTGDPWGDFASAGANQQQQKPSSGPWVQF